MGSIWILTKAMVKVTCILAALPFMGITVTALLLGNLLPAVTCGIIAVFLFALGAFVIKVR